MDKENINDDTMQQAMKALESRQKQYARQNAYNREHFKRITVTVPVEWVPTIQKAAEMTDGPVNAFFKRLMLEELERLGLSVEE